MNLSSWSIHTYNMIISSLLFFLTLLITSTIIILTNPISIGLSILFLALVITVSTSSFSSSWLAFLIFLIYISGILVLFAYFVSLTPNQQPNTNIIIYIISPLSSLLFIFILINCKHPINFVSNWDISEIYNTANRLILIIIALTLLLTIIIVVKLSTLTKGPLRPFYN